MLRVTLNSSCVQFASEEERSDIFLVKTINNMWRGTLGVAKHRITAKKKSANTAIPQNKIRKIPQFHSKPV